MIVKVWPHLSESDGVVIVRHSTQVATMCGLGSDI